MKTFKKLATLLLLIILVCAVSACLPDLSKLSSSSLSGEITDSSIPEDSSIEEITYEYSLNLTSFSIDVGQSRTLRVIVEPEKEIEVQWASDNDAIATVEDGVVLGVAEGTTLIKATVDGQVLECAVTVNALPIVYQYALDKTAEELVIGDTLQLNVVVTPATEESLTVVWNSTAGSVAKVENGLVTALSAGTTTITALVEEQLLSCEVTVTSPVKATSTVVERADANLSDNHESLDTLYWEHYSADGERHKLFAEDLVVTDLFEVCGDFNFWDYKIPLSYNDSVVNLAYSRNTNGKHTPHAQEATISFKVAIDSSVKAIRLYAGAWNATNNITLEWNGVVVATAESFTAGGDSLAREVTFFLEEIDPSITELTVKVTASPSSGNVSVPAIVILGNAPAKQSNVTVNYSKTEMPNLVDGNPANEYFLTELGTQDWIYLNKHEVERMNGGNMILVDTLEVEGNNSFDDYKGNFSWSNGTTNALSSGINNDGQFGAWATVSTKINAETNHVYFWVAGYSSTYYFELYDSQGNLLVSELLHEEEGGVTHSFMIDLAVATAVEDTLMLNIYRTGGANCSVAALAVHKYVDYSYSLAQSEIELQAGTTWERLQAIATPDRRYAVSYQSLNEDIATVDVNGVITGVSEGQAIIKVLIDGEEVGLTATVTVTPAPIEYEYELSAVEAKLIPGQEMDLSVIITPTPTEAPAIVWKSSASDVVSVDNGHLVALKDGEATITALVEGNELACVVTVKTVATATVTTTENNPALVNLSYNDATLDTIYWEHYSGTTVNGSLVGDDIIDLVPGGSQFGDFGIGFNWFNGRGQRVDKNTHNGSHTSGTHLLEAQIKVTTDVKAIRVYVGAWRATNTLSILYNGVVLATAEAFTADWTSQAREITFNLDVKEAATLTLKAEGSNVEGNISLNAITVLGNANKPAPAVSLSMEKTSLIGQEKNVNLTKIGNLDWFYPETDYVGGDPWDPDQKKDANYIDASAFSMSFYNWFGDFGYDKVFFNWTDGTDYPTADGRNDGRWGSISSVTTKVDANVKHVYLWISGWNSSFSVAVMDSHGNLLMDEAIVEAQGNNQPFELNFAVNCATEETLSFVLYTTSSDNSSIVAMAVSGIEDYDYSINNSEIELFEEETSQLAISVSPVKDLHVEYSSSAEGIASVDAYGLITAIAPGEAIITARVDGKEFTCKVIVNERPVEYTYTLNVTQKELIPNETLKLELSVSPSKELQLTYSSTDDGIAEVDTNGLITAKANGSVTISVLDNGVVVAECAITVKAYVVAGESSVANGDGVNVVLGNDTGSLTTLYWERYRDNGEVVAMLNATDLIPTNNAPNVGGGFGDYKAGIGWINGNTIAAWEANNNTGGRCFGGQTVATINVNPAVKQIIVYTGAWNASVYASLTQNGVAIATSETYEAGGTGIARFVTFNLTVYESTTLTLTLNPTSSAGGNASLTAIAILGDKPATTTALTMTKELLPAEFVTVSDKSQPSVSYDLTALGTKDWLYTNFENQGTDEMLNSDVIDSASLRWDGGGKFWDYKAIFTYSNGTKWNTTEGHDKDSDVTYGTNNGVCGAWNQISVNVNEETNHIHLFVGGYQSTYYVLAIDANGTVLHHELLAEGTSAFHLDFAVNASQADKITFILYRPSGNNCSLAAVAVN